MAIDRLQLFNYQDATTIKITDIVSLVAKVLGDTDSSKPKYKDDRLTAEIYSVVDVDLDLEINITYDVQGTGHDSYVNPCPTVDVVKIIAMLAARNVLRGEKYKADKLSIIHSDVAGRDDLTNVSRALGNSIVELNSKIAILVERINSHQSVKDFVAEKISFSGQADTDINKEYYQEVYIKITDD